MAGSPLDDLSRRLSAPMPRRRALRLLGAAIAAAALPGLRPARAAARSPYGLDGRDPRVTTPPSYPPVQCGDVPCTTIHCTKCCMQSNGQPGSCCPCWVSCTQTGSGLCDKPFACSPDARPFCGVQGNCCADHEVCYRGAICVPVCEAGEQRCDEECCPRGFECATLGIGTARQCLPKCKNGRTRCGVGCCPRGQRCLNARLVQCAQCDPGHQPCGRRCCARGARCCDPRRGLCCKASETCAGYAGTARCCPRGTRACEPNGGSGTVKCCERGEVCAQVADATGTVPAANRRRFTCCPPNRVVEFGGVAGVCCPPGYRSLGGRLVVPPGGGGGLCCRADKLCGSGGSTTCCGTNADPVLDSTCCNGTCVSLQFDAANCGSCGNACQPGTRCQQGVCVPA